MRQAPKSSLIHQIEGSVFLPPLIGAGVGALGTFGANRRSRTSIAAGAIIGGVAALAAWSSRRRVKGAVSTGLRAFSTARDYYYIARHPIDYA